MAEPAHNPVKLPLFVACICVGAVLAVVGLVTGDWWVVALGVATIAVSALAIRAIRQGRNPWWLRAPLDRRRSSE